MASYRLSQEAEEDLWRIYQWGFEQYGQEAADKYFSAFFDQFELIAQQPYLYPSIAHIRQGYRKSVCGVDTIYYRVVEDTVEIMAILRKQDRDRWL